MAQNNSTASEPPPAQPPASAGPQGFLRKLFRQKPSGTAPATQEQTSAPDAEQAASDTEKDGLIRRMSRRVVPGLPRAQTFKRQQSEQRVNLTPVEPTPDERRAASVGHRSRDPRASISSQPLEDPRISAPGVLGSLEDNTFNQVPARASVSESQVENISEESHLDQQVPKVNDNEAAFVDESAIHDTLSNEDAQSMTTSQYDAMISDELEKIWILNLSMHFRDRSKREKFFVTYREQEHLWRRVTISLDYRNAPPNSLEMDLIHTTYQREKSAKIYEAIRESLRDIQFYETVTNLKLQTTDGRLHVHVVEDGNEIIPYPSISQIKHLNCRRVRESEITFDSHMSGFVYKVHVNGQTLIKKEIPSPETIDEFLYEVNALSSLRYSRNVIRFHGVVVDDDEEHVKGLLISYAEQGALIDIIYETCKDGEFDIPWETREKWARQIVEGLSDIHESGFVQGDFTLSNIVIDEHNDAKIIDINRRGCPVGWEPPEATPLIDCNQRISMYIGVKSDLYQLGMVLWALATQEDEPEAQGRPLILGPEVNIPDWYRQMAEICLSDDPRARRQAPALLQMFPPSTNYLDRGRLNPPPMSVDEDYTLNQYLGDDYAEIQPEIRTVEQPSDWSYVSRPYAEPSPVGFEPYYHTRGRSPPSPLPSNYDGCENSRRMYDIAAWAANRDIPSSYSDVGHDDMLPDETPIANKTTLIEPDVTEVSETALGDSVQDQIFDEEENYGGSILGKPEQVKESGVATTPMPRPAEIEKAKEVELPEVEYIVEESNTETTKSTEVAGEEYSTVTTQTTSGPRKAEKDCTSIRADSACDVVMPPFETFKEGTQSKDRTPLPPTELVTQTEDVVAANDGPDHTATAMKDVSEENVPEYLTNQEGETPELQQMEEEPVLNAPEEKGITGPEPQEPVTEVSSRTVTPSKAHDSTEGKAISTPAEEHDQVKMTPTLDGKEEGAKSEAEMTLRKDPDSLTGIGAAHLTNDDGDAIRQQKTIDEDLNAVEWEPPKTMMQTNLRNSMQAI